MEDAFVARYSTVVTTTAFHGSRPGPRVRSGGFQNLAGRVGLGQGVFGNLTGRIGSDQEVFKSHGSGPGHPDSIRPGGSDLTREQPR